MYKTVEGRWGTCKFLSKDEYVGKSMYYYGEYNPDETEMILSLAKGTCLDIGANIGCISQALVLEGFDVIAFEPQPEIFKLLEYNLSAVSKDVIGECIHAATHECINAAVGANAGTVHMPRVHYSSKGNFGGLGIGDYSIYGNIIVPINTIDSMNLEDVGFIKIDVEGYELDVLHGAIETIKRYKPIMYIEDDRPENSKALRNYIESLSYTIEEHKPALYRENNFFGLKKNVWDKNYASHNLICKLV